MVRFLSVEAIEALHTQSILHFGGSHGLRDRNLLASAAARPEQTFYYNPEATLGELAATLGWGLIKNHAFVDGNKRIGLIAMITFLDLHVHSFACSKDDLVVMILRAAAGDIGEDEWTAWVVRSVAPKTPELG